MPEKQNLQPLLDAAQNQLGLTFSTSDALDAKLLGIIGFDIAIAIFALQSEMSQTLWLLLPTLGFLLVSLLVGIYAIQPKEYVGALVNIHEHPDYLQMEEEALQMQLLVNTQLAIEFNTSFNNAKTRLCSTALLTGLAGIFLLIGCIL